MQCGVRKNKHRNDVDVSGILSRSSTLQNEGYFGTHGIGARIDVTGKRHMPYLTEPTSSFVNSHAPGHCKP
jgi:hypothetical protein